MQRRVKRGGIQRLLLIVMLLVFISLLAVERIFLLYYHESIKESARTLTNTRADELFDDINEMWYQLNLISATFSRSDAMRAYVRSTNDDTQMMQVLRSAVYMTQLAASNIDSIIVTDFADVELFAYGEMDRQVLKSAERAMQNGLVVKNPVHMQLGTGSAARMYCINRTDARTDGTFLYTIIVYNIDSLRQKLEAVTGEDYGTNLLLLDGNGIPLIESVTLEGRERAQAMSDLRAGETPVDTLFLQKRGFSLMRWQLIAFVQEEALLRRMAMAVRFAYVMGISVFLLLSVFFFVLRKQVNEPIGQILDFMRSQTRDFPQATLELKTKNELDQIAQGLNAMLKRQREMVRENLESKERLYETELSQKQSEIAALTNQINPHFLYNTLDCMHGMALAGGMSDLEEIISSMAYIFRYATRSSAYVRVEEEIESIVRYMNIVRIRHGGRIGACYEIDRETLGLLIPKMILQPIVENAVSHGLETVNRPGALRIHVWREADGLYLTVRDDGKGMDRETLDCLRAGLILDRADTADRSTHIGLTNIHRRIRLLHGPSCGVTVESELGQGTTVTLRLQARRQA